MTGFDFWEVCKAAIAIDSTSEHGNVEYVDFLKKILAPMDLAVRTQDVCVDEYRGLNLIAEKGGGPDVIVFTTHLDTVSPGDRTLWTETGGDPFRATIKDGKIFGLGAVDVKLDFLCKLKALETFVGRRFRNRFMLLGTYGEEVGLLGAKAFLDEYQGQLDLALIGEPTRLKLVNRHKGRGCYAFRVPATGTRSFADTVEIEFAGSAAHSSTPDRGQNAIVAAMWALGTMATPPEFFSVTGGHLLNIVPERCVITAPASEDIAALVRGLGGRATLRPAGPRDLPRGAAALAFWRVAREIGESMPQDTTWVWVTAKTAAESFEFEFDSRFWDDSESLSADRQALFAPVECRTMRKTPSFFEATDAWYVEGVCGALREAGVRAEFESKLASTDAALFGHRCTSLVFGPGPSESNAHRPNEYNIVSEVETAIRAYESILKRLVAVPA